MASSRPAVDAGTTSALEAGLGSAPQPGRLARLEGLPVVAVVALVAYLALVPIAFLLAEAFDVGQGLSLEHFRNAYASVGLAAMAGNSLWFAAGASLVAGVTGTALAFVVVRTDLPWRRLVFAGALVPLIVPGVLYTISWIFLASGRIGLLRGLLPAGLDVFSLPGMMLVEGLHLSPLVFLLMAAAMRSMDPALEEAALMSGAGPATVVRRVTLPLLVPALYASLLVMAVRALESFEVPALLGIPSGIWVFTSRIWKSLDAFPPALGEAGAYAVSLLVVTSLAMLVYSRLVRPGARHETVSGRGARPWRWPLGRWRGLVVGLTAAYLLLAAAVPLAILLYASLQPFYSPPSLQGLSTLTLDSYATVLEAATVRAFVNSMVLAVGTATAVMLVMGAAAWFVVRGPRRGRWLVDNLTALPLVIPGLVIGVALLFVYLRVPLPIYGTLWILFLAYFTRFMPYGMRYAVTSMQQIGREAEEAAHMSGASWTQTFRRVTLPLLLPGLVAGWIYVVIVSVRELSSSIILYSPSSEVLPVRIFVLYEGGQFTDLAALGIVLVVVLVGLALAAYRLGSRVGVWAE